MSIVTGLCMYFSSFFPLWISVLFLDIKSIAEGKPNICTEIISISLIFIFSVISLIVLNKTMNSKDGNGSEVYTLIEAKEEKTITAEFLLSYILPLFAFDFTTWDEVVQFLIFFLVFAFLSIRHNHFSVNVLMELFKYRFYSCQLKNADGVEISKIVICRKILTSKAGAEIRIRPINNEYSINISSE